MDVTQSFLEYAEKLNNFQLDILQNTFFVNIAQTKSEYATVENITIKNIALIKAYIAGTHFINCKFQKVNFTGSWFVLCDFDNCIFESCTNDGVDINQSNFSKSHFLNCITHQMTIADCVFDEVTFVECNPIYEIVFISCQINGLSFIKCRVVNGAINYFTSTSTKHLFFKECSVEAMHFNGIGMAGTKMIDTTIGDCIFTNCIINNDLFGENTKIKDDWVNSIDFQTLILSDKLSSQNLSFFGITDCDAKEYISSMVTPIKYQTVFISYSFKDSDFADYLNAALRGLGINTFLWKHDAPGGKRLKTIMKENIRKYDRVLFIASRDSLKSEACHYELAEARDIQNREWKEIYYPIHIDKYLFEVVKEDIPRLHRENYWTNIEEIREVHSIDFCQFKENHQNNPAFFDKVEKLVKDLKV